MKIVCNGKTFEVNDYLFYGTRVVNYKGYEFKVPENIGRYIDSFLNLDEFCVNVPQFVSADPASYERSDKTIMNEIYEKFIYKMGESGHADDYIVKSCNSVFEFLINSSILVDSVLN